MNARADLPLSAAAMMQRDVFALEPDWPLDRAIGELTRRGYSGAPVVDPNGRILGVLSEADCLRLLASAAFYAVPTGRVADAMHQDLVTVGPDTDAFDLTWRFQSSPIRRVFVVDPDGRLLGLIARRDLLTALDRIRTARSKADPASTYELLRRHREHPV